MGVRINSLVKDFPFVYVCDGREWYDNFVYLFYDKNEELNLTSSDNEIFESIFGFLPKEFSNPNSYTSAFLANVMETSERFERVKVYPIYGTNDFDVELDEVLKKLPNDIIKYYTDIIHNRDTKENQDDKDRKIDFLEKEIKEVKEDFFKFKCKLKYELSGWDEFCKFIKIDFYN